MPIERFNQYELLPQLDYSNEAANYRSNSVELNDRVYVTVYVD